MARSPSPRHEETGSARHCCDSQATRIATPPRSGRPWSAVVASSPGNPRVRAGRRVAATGGGVAGARSPAASGPAAHTSAAGVRAAPGHSRRHWPIPVGHVLTERQNGVRDRHHGAADLASVNHLGAQLVARSPACGVAFPDEEEVRGSSPRRLTSTTTLGQDRSTRWRAASVPDDFPRTRLVTLRAFSWGGAARPRLEEPHALPGTPDARLACRSTRWRESISPVSPRPAHSVTTRWKAIMNSSVSARFASTYSAPRTSRRA
jgi:hypothetical protein